MAACSLHEWDGSYTEDLDVCSDLIGLLSSDAGQEAQSSAVMSTNHSTARSGTFRGRFLGNMFLQRTFTGLSGSRAVSEEGPHVYEIKHGKHGLSTKYTDESVDA